VLTRPSSHGPAAPARRRLFATLLAAFVILNPIAFIFAPPAAAQTSHADQQSFGGPGFGLAEEASQDEPPQPNLSVTTLGTSITQNFNMLPASGSATWTNDSTLPGWYHARTGTGTTIVANDGSSNAGNLYSYGTGTNTDRALGSLGSGNAAIGNLFWGIRLTNNTGSTITSLDVSYTGEQWRNSAAAAQTISFSYLIGSPTVTGSLAEFQSAGVAVPQLDFTSPITGGTAAALNGNLAANRVTLTHSITGLNIPNGTEVMLRWSDPDHTGADHGLSIDDFSVTAQGGAAPLTLGINDVSQDEGNSGQTAFTFTVSLSSSTHGGVTFDIATADGTAQDDNPTSEDNDYQANSATGVTIPNGSQSAQFTVQVNGDTTGEPNETFFVNVTNVTGATVTDGQGQGTIVNDDLVITPIHVIQGNGAASPLAGQTGVTTEGIVTLLKTGSNAGSGAASGFFLQTTDGNADADPNTSQGIFVFTSSVPTVAVGDAVRVTGSVVEFNGLTEITSPTSISVQSTGNALPTAVALSTADLPPTGNFAQPQLEKYEAMRLSAASLTTVAPTDNFFDVYTVITGQPRPVREPGIEANLTVPPDPTSGTPDCCIPRFDLNPERLKLDTNGRAGSPNQGHTSNVVLTNVAGPLDYAFNEYRLIAQAPLTASTNMSAVAVPAPAAGEFTVGSFNIENFNNNATQRQKAALAIRNVMRSPDIIGHAEIASLSALQALATQVNNDAVGAGEPNPMYEARLIPAATGTQHVGFLVKTSRVRIDAVTQERASDTFINPNTGNPETLHDRPPLVLRATVEPAGANLPVIVVVNHLRSFIDIGQDPGEGPRVRAKRKAQAESLAGLLQELQTNSPGVSVISVGDYNAFQFADGYTDPVSVIKGTPTPDDQIVVDQSPDLVNPDFFNLTDELPTADQYTFIFNGTPQALDHVLVNNVGRARRTRYHIARNNADFPEDPAAAFASNAARPERNSDHDMPVAYFTTAAASATAGQLIISELRLRGPAGALDEFVELYNNTNSDLTVNAFDGSAGFALAASDGVVRCTIPNGTVIPARGHYLCVNSVGYTLASYPAGNGTTATGDATYTTDIPDNVGVALFNTANAANFTLANRLDAAGSSSEANTLYREGTGYPPLVTFNIDYSYYRDLASGTPLDTGDNNNDFLFVDINGTCALSVGGGCQSLDGTRRGRHLGAPGPENLSSPIQRTNLMPTSLIAPCVAATQSPNRVRDLTDDPSEPNDVFGTLDIRRRFTNATGANVTRLRFRIVDITTFPVPTGTADFRALSSTDVVVSNPCTGTTQTVRGTTLEQPPTQGNGGGFNSSLSAGTITLATPLAPGATIDVRFRLGVQQTGSFRFFVIVETLP
jgi:uncharacterized protein